MGGGGPLISTTLLNVDRYFPDIDKYEYVYISNIHPKRYGISMKPSKNHVKNCRESHTQLKSAKVLMWKIVDAKETWFAMQMFIVYPLRYV